MLVALRLVVLVTVVGAMLAIPPAPASADTTVENTLREFEITAAPSTGEQGTVTFQVSNEGAIPHNFIVIDTDLAPDGLPLTPDGLYVDEAQVSIAGRTSELLTGGFETLSLNLPAGNYILICNNAASHYTAGMRLGFAVTAQGEPTATPPTDGEPTATPLTAAEPTATPPTAGEPTATPPTADGATDTGGPATYSEPEDGSTGYWWVLPTLAALGAGVVVLGMAIHHRTR